MIETPTVVDANNSFIDAADSVTFKVIKDSSGHALAASDNIVKSVLVGSNNGGAAVHDTHPVDNLTDVVKPN